LKILNEKLKIIKQQHPGSNRDNISRNMSQKILKNSIIIIILIFGGQISAQKVIDSVKTEVIEVTRSFDPKVQDAYKLAVNPEINAVPEKKIPVTFQIQSVPVASTFQPEKGSMAGFNPGSLTEDVYASYVALSGGNYTQLQGDAFVYYPLTDQLSSALRLSHYSSQGDKNEAIVFNPFYHTAVDALFNYQADKSNWQFDLGYDGHINNLNLDNNVILLIPPDIQTLKNTFNNLHLDVKGNFKESTFRNIKLAYNNLWDGFDNSEHLIHLSSDLIIPVGEFDLKMGVQTDMVTGNTGKFGFTKPAPNLDLNYKNMDAGILPAVQIKNDKLTANLGAKIFYQNDSIYNKVQIMPDVNVHLNLIYEKLTVFAGATGDLHQYSQTEFYKQNPYLSLRNTIHPRLTPYNIFGGFNGAFSSSFSYEVRLGVQKIKNYAFYNYDGIPTGIGSYDIVYDDMTQSYFKTGLNIGVGKKLDLKLDLTYMQNHTDQLKKALFLPDFDFKSIFIFKPTDKLNFNVTLNSVGKRSIQVVSDKNLNAYTDLNLGVRYNINKQFTAFVNAYNVLNHDYQIFYGYPVQKLQVMAGAAYRFDISGNN